MSLLLPLGFLGLIGLGALLLIYLLKPNYQQKSVSSTYIWKLSLKYRKKKIPISKLRNILLIICQILIIVLCAFILVKPVTIDESRVVANEKIFVIDASASMLVTNNLTDSKTENTRFERAVEEAREFAEEVFENGGTVTVILAEDSASVLAYRVGANSENEVYDALDSLLIDEKCTYGEVDIDGAMELTKDIVASNGDAEVYLFTDKDYLNSNSVNVVNVSRDDEWNASILNVNAALVDNYYTFTLDVACYGRATDFTLYCYVTGANYEEININFNQPVHFIYGDSEVQTIEFNTANMTTPIYTYSEVLFRLDVVDSFTYDNNYYLYGGKQEVIKVQYYSSAPNNFISNTLITWRESCRRAGTWDVDITEVRTGEPALEGFDLYIFEHSMPKELPTDGVLLLINPDDLPDNVGITLGKLESGVFTLASGINHPVTNLVDIESIEMTQYTRVAAYDSDNYDVLMYCGGDPVLLLKNTEFEKVMVLTLRLNNSILPVGVQFPMLFYNFFNYFFPITLTQNVFNVNDTAELNARGKTLTISGAVNDLAPFEEFPATLKLTEFGVYKLSQTLISGDLCENYMFVKIPASESKIDAVGDVISSPYVAATSTVDITDLLVYFAAVLVTLLFAEWWLHSRENA